MPGLGAQRHPGGSARLFGDDHLGGGDGSAIVADLDVLMQLMPGRAIPPDTVQDPDAAGPRSGVRIREPVPPGAPAGGGDAGRRSDCTVHSAVVSASNLRKGRDSAAALPSAAAATTSSAAATSRAYPVPAAAPAPRSPSPVQPARHTRSPGPSAAGVLTWRFLVTCQVPRRARLPPPRPRCARLPAPAGLSPRCTGRHLRPSRSGRRRAPSRPRTRPQPRQSVLHIRIRAPTAASTSRQWPRLHHPIRLARPAQPRHSHLAPCGSRSGSTPNKTSACHPLCVRHGCHLRGIGGMDLLSAR